MAEKSAPNGCIKNTRGPWKIKKTSKDGQVVIKLQFPTERERQNSQQRERQRWSLTWKIFEGLRLYGNYQLPKKTDTNDLLKLLCEEAGWHVEEDGTIYKKGPQDYSTCNNSGWTTSISLQPRESQDFLKLFSNS